MIDVEFCCELFNAGLTLNDFSNDLKDTFYEVRKKNDSLIIELLRTPVIIVVWRTVVMKLNPGCFKGSLFFFFLS